MKFVIQVEEDEESGEDFTKELDGVPADSDEEEEEPKPKKAPAKKPVPSKKASAATTKKKAAPKKQKVCTTLMPGKPSHLFFSLLRMKTLRWRMALLRRKKKPRIAPERNAK